MRSNNLYQSRDLPCFGNKGGRNKAGILCVLFAVRCYQVAKMVRSKFYTPNEVSVHNTMEDLWVSFLGKVYDLTPLCKKFKGGLFIFAILFLI